MATATSTERGDEPPLADKWKDRPGRSIWTLLTVTDPGGQCLHRALLPSISASGCPFHYVWKVFHCRTFRFCLVPACLPHVTWTPPLPSVPGHYLFSHLYQWKTLPSNTAFVVTMPGCATSQITYCSVPLQGFLSFCSKRYIMILGSRFSVAFYSPEGKCNILGSHAVCLSAHTRTLLFVV